MTPEQLGHHITQVLGRIEASAAKPHTYVCTACGCLCRRGESCPSCALAGVRVHREAS